MVRESGRGLGRRSEVSRAVPAPPGLRLLQRPPEADGDQRILERRPRGVVHMDVAGRHALDPEPLGEIHQPAIAGPVEAPERPLELDPEAVAAEGADEPPPQRLRGRRVGGARPSAPSAKAPRERPVASAAREADEPLGPLLERAQRQGGGRGSRPDAGRVPRGPR